MSLLLLLLGFLGTLFVFLKLAPTQPTLPDRPTPAERARREENRRFTERQREKESADQQPAER